MSAAQSQSQSWEQLRAQWSPAWKALAKRGQQDHLAAIQRDPTRYAPTVASCVDALSAARASLIQARAKGLEPARLNELERRWLDLAAGIYAEATPAPAPPSFGLAPVIVVGGIAFTAVALSWAAVAWQYIANLRDQTAFAVKELEVRDAASRDGRALQPATAPAQPPVPPPGDPWTLDARGLLGLGALAGLAFFIFRGASDALPRPRSNP